MKLIDILNTIEISEDLLTHLYNRVITKKEEERLIDTVYWVLSCAEVQLQEGNYIITKSKRNKIGFIK